MWEMARQFDVRVCMLLILGSRMLTIGISLAVTIGALGLVAYHLRQAPEGYEDDRGFHPIRRTPGSKITRSVSPPSSSSLASLRGAKASR